MAKQQQPAPKAQPAKSKVTKAAEVVFENLIPDTLGKKIFIALSVLLIITMAYLSKDYGITGDENFHRVYGHHVWHFYTSGGADKTATLPYGNPDSLMMYYGGFYDGTAAGLSEAMPSVNEWSLRHFWNSIFGALAMIFAGLVAVEILGWQAGIITLVFMILSPRFFGESMNNPKDITMATGYVISYYFILKFLKQLPRPKVGIAIGLGVAIGVALGIRIGGLLLIPYFLMFYGIAMWQMYGLGTLFNFGQFKENVWPSFKYVLLACVLGFALGMFFWPYGLIDPIGHTKETLGISQKFPAQIRMLFDGAMISSTDITWNYIPTWLWISTPLFGIIGLVASFALIPYFKRNGKLLLLGFIYFTLAFPVFYIIYKKAVLYDGMRHMYFVYPSIIILAGLAFSYFISTQKKNIKYAVLGVAVVLLLLPARFMFANHPNQAVYFNELAGGINGAFGNYETDYYMNSVKQCADWIKENEKIERRPDGSKMIIYSNAVGPAGQYFIKDTAKVGVGYISYRNRCTVDADYQIFYSRFVDRDLLLNGCFPPEQAAYVVEVDGKPIACVLKKTDKSDFLGQQAMQRNDFDTAIKLLEPYCAKYPKADVAMQNLALAYLSTANVDPTRVQKGIELLNKCVELNKENIQAIYYLSQAYRMIGNTTQAQYLENMVQQMQR